MTAKEYLNQVRVLDARIRNLQQEADDLRDSILPGGISCRERVQGSPDPDPYGTWAGRVEEKEQQINREIDLLVDLKADITRQINSLQDVRYMKVLYLRHVRLMRFRDIAAEMGYSHKYVRGLHKQALQAFGRQYCKE